MLQWGVKIIFVISIFIRVDTTLSYNNLNFKLTVLNLLWLLADV